MRSHPSLVIPGLFLLPLVFGSGCTVTLLSNSVSTTLTANLKDSAVEPRYTAAAQWNDFTRSSDTEVACSGVETDCIHGGSLRQITIPGLSSCLGHAIHDALMTFDWTCDDSSGQAVFLGILKPQKSLADLVTAAGWRENQVILTREGIELDRTSPSVWWNNAVVPLPGSETTPQVLDEEGTIYVAAESMSPVKGYNINADRISIAILSGVQLVGDGTHNHNTSTYEVNSPNDSAMFSMAGQKFVSIEGAIDWTFGVTTAPHWTLDGNHLTRGVIRFKTSPYTRLHQITMRKSLYRTVQMHTMLGFRYVYGHVAQSGGGSSTAMNITAMSHSRMQYLNVTDNSAYALDLYSGSHNEYRNLYIANHTVYSNSMSIWTSGSDELYQDIVSENSRHHGLSLGGSNHRVINVTVRGSIVGSCLSGSGTGTTWSNLQGSGCAGGGFSLTTSAASNTAQNLTLANNGTFGISDLGTGNRLSGIRSFNNGTHGFVLGGTGGALTHALAAFNSITGISITGTAKSLAGITTVKNKAEGVLATSTGFGIIHNLVSYANGSDGIQIAPQTTGSTLSQVVAIENQGYGIHFQDPADPTTQVKVSANLLVGGNLSGDCRVPVDGMSVSKVTGVQDGTCALSGDSDGMLRSGLSLSGSFKGMVFNDDLSSGSDHLGAMTAAAASDWTRFSTATRVWGLDENQSSPDINADGRCSVGEACRIWDWSLADQDNVLRNTSHDGLTQNPGNFMSEEACPSAILGSEVARSSGSTSVYLTSAIERMGDSIGDDDGLCESGETCVYAPNFGVTALQATGLSFCLYSANGGLTDISLLGN